MGKEPSVETPFVTSQLSPISLLLECLQSHWQHVILCLRRHIRQKWIMTLSEPFWECSCPLKSQRVSATPGKRVCPLTTRLKLTPSLKWISLKSGFPSTNVKLSLLNFRSCSRTRKPGTTMPLRFTAKETPFWLSMSYNQKWCKLTLTGGLTTKATKGRSSLIWGISCSTFLERVFFGARTFPSLVCGHTTINLAYLKRLADKILARHPRNTNSTHL